MLEIGLKIKHLSFFGLFFVFALNGCVTFSLPPLLTATPENVAKEQWSDYGAVYEYDELRILTEDLFVDQGWNSFYYINKKLHILTLNGVKYGTVKVPKYSDVIADFKVRLWDPAGNEVPLNLDVLLKKYSKTGKIIVPKVEPGCQIGINLVFREANLVYSHEHWFERQIPVINGRFSIFYPADVKYTCKAYGDIAPSKRQRAGVYIGRIWDKKNIIPEDDIFENRWHFAREPHIMARLDRWSWNKYRWDAPDWKGLARKCKAYFLSPSIYTSRSNIKKTVHRIIDNRKTMFAKADAILAYVQDDITLDREKNLNLEAVNLNRVLRDKSGDYFEIAVLLKEMLEAAGFSTRVYVTRGQSYGGFDPEFPTWRYISIPLVVLNFGGKEYVAYPYNRFMGLGEYPFSLNNLQALDIERGTIVRLPKSVHTAAKLKSLGMVSLGNQKDTQTWQLSYDGYYATFIRKKMAERTQKKREAYFRSLIRRYDKGNKLQDADLQTINRQGKIKITLESRNVHFKTQGANASHYSLSPWFCKYFTDYDKSRKVNYTNDMVLVYEDGVLITGKKGDRQTYQFECTNIDNPLFSTQCEQKVTDKGMLLLRKLTIKQADLAPEQMQDIYPDIVTLNRIDESYVIEKN